MEFLSRFPFVVKYAKGSTNLADPVSRNPLLYDPATPNTVICVGTLGVLLSVMTRGQKRSKELRQDADLSHQHSPLPPLVMEREDLVDSPEHDMRDTDVRQDATMRKNLTRPTPAPFTTQELGGGERVTPHSSGTCLMETVLALPLSVHFMRINSSCLPIRPSVLQAEIYTEAEKSRRTLVRT